MSRQTSKEMKNGLVFNGFDYELQVWVKDGIVQMCGHPDYYYPRGTQWKSWAACCQAKKYAGLSLHDVLAERGMLNAQGI